MPLQSCSSLKKPVVTNSTGGQVLFREDLVGIGVADVDSAKNLAQEAAQGPPRNEVCIGVVSLLQAHAEQGSLSA